MRAYALAAATAALALIGAAEARPWADPAGRLTFDAPNGWTVNTPPGSPATLTYVIAGTASNECQFMAISNTRSAAATPASMRRQGADPARFGNDVWTAALSQFTDLTRSGAPTIVSTSIDTSGFWPIQRAEARVGERPVHAAIQVRPGVDIIAACLTYDGADPVALYETVTRSIGHPNDAAWRTAAEAEAAAPPPAPPPPPPPPPEDNRRRNRD